MRFLALFLILCAGCPHSLPPPETYTKWPDPRGKELILDAGDVVSVKVIGDNKDLDTETAIRADGTITIPLVGDVKAAGDTPSALKAKIQKALSNFVKIQGSEVTVGVKAWNSYRWTVEGEISRPGVYTAQHFVRMDEALAMAGGTTRFARRDRVKLFRKDPATGQETEIPFDYDALMSGERPDMNIFIMPGDRIYVP